MRDIGLTIFSVQVQAVVLTNVQLLLLILTSVLLVLVCAFVFYHKRSQKALARKEEEMTKLQEQVIRETAHYNLLKSEVSSTSERLNHLGEFKAALDHLIGHDLKNTLNSILGLSRDKDDETMKAVQACGQLALSMLSNMLDVQRFEEERVYLRLRHHCVRETIIEAQAQVQFLFLAKRLNMKVDIPEGTLVLIDKEMMSRVLVNLLVNAVKYSKLGSTVEVSVRNVVGASGEPLTEISVKDQGEGITPSKLPYIFGRYWQNGTQEIGKLASAGLGLVFCKQVTQSHGGSIVAESSPGIGTRISLYIPFVEAMVEGCETHHESLSILRDEVSITEEQLKLIRLHGQKLNELKVYEITKIREVIDALSELEIKTIWTGELQMAVYQGDQSKYDELVGMIQ